MAALLSHVRLFFSIAVTPLIDEKFEDFHRDMRDAFPVGFPFEMLELEYDPDGAILVIESLKMPDQYQIIVLQSIIEQVAQKYS